MTQATSPREMPFRSRCLKIVKPIADSLFGEGVEGRANPFEAAG